MTQATDDTPLIPRKRPRQRRSKATVEAILEATARVLLEVGYDKASTNRIAKVAGVSVGSLYQYFPNKEALLLALAERHSNAMLARLGALGPVLQAGSIEDTVRAFVQAMLAAHSVQPELHRIVMAQILQLNPLRMRQVEQTAIDIVRAHLSRRPADLLVKNIDIAAFVLVTAVEAITHRAVLDRPDLLHASELVDEICDLVVRYLIGSQPPPPVTTD